MNNKMYSRNEIVEWLQFLYNDYPCPIFYIDLLYPTVEHAYQAQKIEIRKRGEERRIICDLTTARQARIAGNKIQMSEKYALWFKNN